MESAAPMYNPPADVALPQPGAAPQAAPAEIKKAEGGEAGGKSNAFTDWFSDISIVDVAITHLY